MKKEKTTTSTFKVGQVLFLVDYSYNDENSDKMTFESSEWHIRTIRVGGRLHKELRITAIRKTKFTWVKLSTKNGDWGWAKKIDSVDRITFRISDPAMRGLSLTKPGAWQKARDRVVKYAEAGPYQEMALNTCNQQIAKTTGRRPGGKK